MLSVADEVAFRLPFSTQMLRISMNGAMELSLDTTVPLTAGNITAVPVG